MTEQMLRQYTVLVEYLGKTLGPDYEVVLHEILPENSRVAAIANGSISGRSVGAPITNAALRMIMQKELDSLFDHPPRNCSDTLRPSALSLRTMLRLPERLCDWLSPRVRRRFVLTMRA